MNQQPLSKRRIVVAAICIILLVCLIYFTAKDRDRLSVAEKAVREIFSPIARGASKVSREISSWASYLISIGETKAENEKLREELDALRYENLQMEEALRENERLRDLLEFKESLGGRAVAARISYRDPGNWLYSVAIDKGSDHGISSGKPVVTARGVVGRVTSVTRNTSTVILTVDSRSAVGGIDFRSRDLVLVEGLGDGSGLLHVRPLGADNDVQPGDIIITSGFGGIYPKGYVLGDVISVAPGKYGVSKSAFARPRVDFDRLEEVLVLIDPIRGAIGEMQE